MRKIRSFIGVFALIAAGALLAAGCKQPGDSAGNNGGTTTPGGSSSGGGTNQGGDQGTGKTTVFTSALQFKGKIGPTDSTEAEKKILHTYDVSVTLSHNRVGASAEDPVTGYIYMGSADYDEKGGSVDVTLVNVRNAEDTISLAGTYQSATKMLRITEFGGEERNAMLPLQSEKKITDAFKTYTLPVDLPVIGKSVLLFRVTGQHATVAVIAGAADSATSNVSPLTTYEASGLIARGNKLTVQIPLDTKNITQAKSVLKLIATVDADGVKDIRSSILTFQGRDGALPGSKAGEDHLNNTVLPYFSPAKFTFKCTSGNYYALVLEAVPYVKHTTSADADIDTALSAKREEREGYRMIAQFFKYGNTEASLAAAPTAHSIPVVVEGKLGAATQTYTDESESADSKDPSGRGRPIAANQPVFEFEFALGCFTETSEELLCKSTTTADLVGLKITDWKPIVARNATTGDDVAENVTTGDFKLAILGAPATAKVTGGDLLGVNTTKLSGPDKDYTAKDGTLFTVGGAAVNTLFHKGEFFKKK